MSDDGDWQMVGGVVAGKVRVMLHQCDGRLRLKLRLLAERDPETGRRTGANVASVSAFFDSGACKELVELRELLDRAAMLGPSSRVKHGPACDCTPCKAEPSYEARRG